MTTYIKEIINPETQKRVKVGGVCYTRLVKEGRIPMREILIIDGVKCLDASTYNPKKPSQSKTKKEDREEKIERLNKYKEQKDKEKRAKKKEAIVYQELDKYRQLYETEKTKKKALKKMISDKDKLKPIQESPYEYKSTSSSTSST